MDEQHGMPLPPSRILEDILADHANKSVTVGPFIHAEKLQAASVHPCKHSSVMKKVIERMNNSVVAEQLAQRKKDSKDGKKKWLFGRKPGSSEKDTKKVAVQMEEEEIEGMRVDFYLFYFLKFIGSIIPTIELS